MTSKAALKHINGEKNILLTNDLEKNGYSYWKKI